MNPIRFGLIGVGNIGEFHARAIQLVDGAELVAVQNRTAETGEKFAAQFDCAYEPTLEGLLARPDIDAVAITTPSGTHAQIGIAAARAGKHVLCEKPIDISTERIDALVNACDEHKVVLGAIFQSRFGATAQAVKRAVEQGRFGRIVQSSVYVPWFRSEAYYASAGWRGTWELDGGGALMNQGIHSIDLLLWLVGDVTEISARVQTRLRPIPVEDSAVAWLQFAHGGIGVIQASTACYPGDPRRLVIHGEKGSVTLVDDRPDQWEFDEERPEDAAIRDSANAIGVGGGSRDPKDMGVEGHRVQVEDFVGAIREGREPVIPGREGRRSVAVIQAIYKSSESGAIVVP